MYVNARNVSGRVFITNAHTYIYTHTGIKQVYPRNGSSVRSVKQHDERLSISLTEKRDISG